MKRTIIALAFAAISAISTVSAQNPGMAAIFRSWGFIGDSLCSGEMECYAEGNPNVKYVDLYEYSWGQQLCRLCGSEGHNFSHGGQTARGWLEEMEGVRGWGWAKYNPKQAYIIAMGVNDYYNQTISIEDYASQMAEIVSRVKSVSPDAYFFVMTRPKEGKDYDYDKWNDVLRKLPSQFDRLYVIDMFNDAPEYDSAFKEKYYLNGHLSPAGYLFTAYYLMGAIDRIIRENPADFKEVALVGTSWKGSRW